MSHNRLTPETLLSLPRPGAAVPNPSGTFYLLPYSHFDFDTGRTTKSISLGKIPSAADSLDAPGTEDNAESSGHRDHHLPVYDVLTDLRYSETVWLDNENIIYLRPRGAKPGEPDVNVEMSDKEFKASLDKEEQEPGVEFWLKHVGGDESYKIGEVPVAVSDLKLQSTSSTTALLSFVAEVYPSDPSLDAVAKLDEEAEKSKRGADVMVFDKLYIRHWDTWAAEKKKMIFFVELAKEGKASGTESDDLEIKSLSSSDEEDYVSACKNDTSAVEIDVSLLTKLYKTAHENEAATFLDLLSSLSPTEVKAYSDAKRYYSRSLLHACAIGLGYAKDPRSGIESPDWKPIKKLLECKADATLLDVLGRTANQIVDEEVGVDAAKENLTKAEWQTFSCQGKKAKKSTADSEGFVNVISSGSGAGPASHWSITSTPKTPVAAKSMTLESPPRPFGDTHDFDISGSHLAFVSKDPHLPEAWHSRCHVYLVPLYPRNESEQTPRAITSQGGARTCPIFSPAAKRAGGKDGPSKGRLAYLEMKKDGYEADRNDIIVYDLDKNQKYLVAKDWDRSPASVAWGEDEHTLYVTAEEEGHKKLWIIENIPQDLADESTESLEPKALTHAHTVTNFSVLPTIVTKESVTRPSPPANNSRVLVTINSFTSPNEAYLLSPASASSRSASLKPVSELTTSLTANLSLSTSESFWFSGADPDVQVHGFLMKPAGYEKGQKYGLAFLVHGGPQSAWLDGWSTRWNLNAWAAKGYVVAAINPTGSTGYGQKFTDDINQNWGGKPYKDLVAGLEFLKRAYSDIIDHERMVMLGASYGGYMANWIQGHNDVTKFKAIVCHDGIFNTTSTWYTTEELYFPEHDLGGTPWEVQANYEKWNPANHVRNWKTPELIIHGGLDYRLPETEGIAVFNALQRRGVPSKLVYFPKENHWVLNPYNSRKWHEEVFKWMEEFIGTGASK